MYLNALGKVDKESHQIFKATIGCIFFGTPHVRLDGSPWAQTSSQISQALAYSPSMTQLPTSVLGSVEAEDVLQLSSAFVKQACRLRIISCVETLPTSSKRGKLMVCCCSSSSRHLLTISTDCPT